jgi:hypothetical protein
VTGDSPQALLSRIVEEFERRRWRDTGGAGLQIVRAIERSGGQIDPAALARIPSRTFLAVNRATRADVCDAVTRALRGLRLAVGRPPLIPIEAIGSFAKAAEVTPQQVSPIVAKKLPLPEQTVKEYIAEIIGEPYVATDWGGELSDILTSRIELDGQRVAGAFLLKGKGSKQKLKPADLGKNGDQIRRLSKQDADLYVVQHVGEFDEAVRDQLADMVLARRSRGAPNAVGSLWDGSDCARLFVAHGLIDPATGQPLQQGRRQPGD